MNPPPASNEAVALPGGEFARYFAASVGGLAINDLVMFLAVGRCGLAVLTGNLAAAGCTFLFNYTARKLALF